MRFFIPRTTKIEVETVYREILNALKTQFRLPILERRIFSLSYVNSKKKWYAEVGQLEEHENRYEIQAIFESKQYIVFTRTPAGAAGPIILVDKNEVTDAEDFEAPGKPRAVLNPREGATSNGQG